MKTSISNTEQSLWIGLDSYSESNSDIFYGRDDDVQHLSNDIFHNIQTIIYGPSGTGKTSLIRAGIFKVARSNGYLPVYVRLSHDKANHRPYFKQIIDAIEQEARSREIDVDQVTKYIEQEGNEFVPKSLWEYLHCNEFWTKENYPVVPMIVIDQFEEIFTLGKDKASQAEFFAQISELCDNKLPDYIKTYVNNRENDRIEYNESINYRFVISLREDFLARLEEQADKIPALKRNRYSLQCINEEQALEIITKPAPGMVSDEVAIQIIEKVTNKKHNVDFFLHDEPDISVEPSILSLFCSELDKKRRECGYDKISMDLIGEFGDNIIKEFYVGCLKELSEEKVEFLESRLLTVDGYRNAVAFSDALSFGFTEEEIFRLTDRRLIRIDEWYGTLRLELTHDVLCKVALPHREECAQEKAARKIREEEQRKMQILKEEQERERTKRNREYNTKQRAAARNVLTHKGRRLIDNSLDFGSCRTVIDIPYRNAADNILDAIRLMASKVQHHFDDDSDSEFRNQQVFGDPLLKDSICKLLFYKDGGLTPTIDGLYAVELKYYGNQISYIFFRGKKVLSDGRVSYDAPIYTLGGYCGIQIEYDDDDREICRIYLDDRAYPTVTRDGYSMVSLRYDKYDNPIETRYFNSTPEGWVPAIHKHGNHGFNSVFDKNGNEVLRLFVDASGQPVQILSGVYGKCMSYDPETYLMTSVSNVDSQGNLMPDYDGYVTHVLIYEDRKQVGGMYLDANGEPWETPEGAYGGRGQVDQSAGVIVSQALDKDGTTVVTKDGVYKTFVYFNERKQITKLYMLDANGAYVEDGDNAAVKVFEYDDHNRVRVFKILNKDGHITFARQFDYNKEGTYVIREFAISETGAGYIEEYGVEGLEYDMDGDENLPILRIFINEFKQFKPCKYGYNALRTWEDSEGRLIREMYYDVDGTPMPNLAGVYGIRKEYVDEFTVREEYLDADGNITPSNNGVTFFVTEKKDNVTVRTEFTEKGVYAYLYTETEYFEGGRKERKYILDSERKHMVWRAERLANNSWERIKCSFEEIVYDHNDRPVAQYFRDVDDNLVGDSDGDSYTIWEYNQIENEEVLSLYDVKDNLKLRLKKVRDFKGRIIGRYYLDKDSQLTKCSWGYSGEIIQYNDDENMKVVTYIDSEHQVCDTPDGYAQKITWFDQFGRAIGNKEVTADGTVCGGYVTFREFVDTEDRECAYYTYRKTLQGDLVPNEEGIYFNYYEDDESGRTLRHLYLNQYKQPMCDEEGDYGEARSYDDAVSLTIITCLDQNGNPHNNKLGYGIMHIYKNEEDKIVKRMYFDMDGVPVILPSLLGCYGLCYEYPSDGNRVVGYLNQDGEVTLNSAKYAYKEECYNKETEVRRVFYYDVNRDNTWSEEDDDLEYGYAIVYEDDWRRVLSLDKSGSIVNNAKGYAAKSELHSDGELRFFKFQDEDGNAVRDRFGDYGTELQYSSDGSMIRYVSLDANYNRHINDYGFCYRDVVTDIAGDKFIIYRDLKEEQVLSKLRLSRKIRNYLAKFKRAKKTPEVFNARQIGAIYDCLLGRVESKSLARKYGMHAFFILLEYDEWLFGEDIDNIKQKVRDNAKSANSLLLLPITLEGSVLKEVGDVVQVDFPSGYYGIRFEDWGVNANTIQTVLEKVRSYETQTSKPKK